MTSERAVDREAFVALCGALDDVPVPAARSYVMGGGASEAMADALVANLAERGFTLIATPAPRENGSLLVLHVEYAIEHLTDFAKTGTVFEDVRDVLHAGLAGKPRGIGTAVGTRCPVCGALMDPRGEVEPHR